MILSPQLLVVTVFEYITTFVFYIMSPIRLKDNEHHVLLGEVTKATAIFYIFSGFILFCAVVVCLDTGSIRIFQFKGFFCFLFF